MRCRSERHWKVLITMGGKDLMYSQRYSFRLAKELFVESRAMASGDYRWELLRLRSERGMNSDCSRNWKGGAGERMAKTRCRSALCFSHTAVASWVFIVVECRVGLRRRVSRNTPNWELSQVMSVETGEFGMCPQSPNLRHSSNSGKLAEGTITVNIVVSMFCVWSSTRTIVVRSNFHIMRLSMSCNDLNYSYHDFFFLAFPQNKS